MNRQQRLVLFLFLPLVLFACSDRSGNDAGRPDMQQDGAKRNENVPDADATNGTANEPVEENRLIVPGERIGQTRIGESLEQVNKILGPPDSSDAGMGHVWEYRSSPAEGEKEAHTLDIYASFDEEATGHYVRQIRINSPWFVTEEGIRTGVPFDAVRSVYPGLVPIAEYRDEKKYVVYDDIQEGIGFEFDAAEDNTLIRCAAVVVHEPGRKINNAYIPLQDYMEIGPGR